MFFKREHSALTIPEAARMLQLMQIKNRTTRFASESALHVVVPKGCEAIMDCLRDNWVRVSAVPAGFQRVGGLLQARGWQHLGWNDGRNTLILAVFEDLDEKHFPWPYRNMLHLCHEDVDVEALVHRRQAAEPRDFEVIAPWKVGTSLGTR